MQWANNGGCVLFLEYFSRFFLRFFTISRKSHANLAIFYFCYAKIDAALQAYNIDTVDSGRQLLQLSHHASHRYIPGTQELLLIERLAQKAALEAGQLPEWAQDAISALGTYNLDVTCLHHLLPFPSFASLCQLSPLTFQLQMPRQSQTIRCTPPHLSRTTRRSFSNFQSSFSLCTPNNLLAVLSNSIVIEFRQWRLQTILHNKINTALPLSKRVFIVRVTARSKEYDCKIHGKKNLTWSSYFEETFNFCFTVLEPSTNTGLNCVRTGSYERNFVNTNRPTFQIIWHVFLFGNRHLCQNCSAPAICHGRYPQLETYCCCCSDEIIS